MILVLLIFAWAAVLVPPYLKDRRVSITAGLRGGSDADVSAQRFLPLEHAASNVVQLHPTSTVARQGEAVFTTPPDDVTAPAVLGNTWASKEGALSVPSTRAAAAERRRRVVAALVGVAFVTLLAAFGVGGIFITLHVIADLAALGYVILLVRHRNMANAQASRPQPIRPAVTVASPRTMQVAPDYLLRSGTGS